jgi:2-polyprenyl-3-methyl-5-hydroxy-6-metoxy-1,4-benzoquinol methylase
MAINSCGPFVHSHYKIEGEYFSQEGPLLGRAKFLVDSSLNTLKSLQLKQPKILDVGAYDGFVLNSISRCGYSNLVGIEPRIENIERGKVLRKLLGIQDETRHYAGTLENPGEFEEKDFDLALCFGVIHHINDILGFIADLRAVLKPGATLLLETLVLSDSLMHNEFQDALEAKDLIYKHSKVETSYIGVKLESHYYPGSAITSGTVQVPTLQTLLWFLEFSGFKVEEVLPGWEKSNPAELLKSSHRNKAKSVLIKASAVSSRVIDDQINAIVVETERNLTYGVLDRDVLKSLVEAVESHSQAYDENLRKTLVSIIEREGEKSPFQCEIIASILHEPRIKLKFELAKYELLNSGGVSLDMLISLVGELNTDWRTTYRAFNILAGYDLDNESFWKTLAKRSNPEYPHEAIEPQLFSF